MTPEMYEKLTTGNNIYLQIFKEEPSLLIFDDLQTNEVISQMPIAHRIWPFAKILGLSAFLDTKSLRYQRIAEKLDVSPAVFSACVIDIPSTVSINYKPKVSFGIVVLNQTAKEKSIRKFLNGKMLDHLSIMGAEYFFATFNRSLC